MFRCLGRLIMLAVLVGIFLLLIRPGFIANAGNALLNSTDGSTTYGSVQVLPSVQGKGSELQVNLQGLFANLPYVVTLDEGACGGKALATVGGVSTDGSGGATSTFALKDVNTVAQQGLWVDVHQGKDPTGTTVACGRIEINSDAASQVANASASSSDTSSASFPTISSSDNGLNGVSNSSSSSTSNDTQASYTYQPGRGINALPQTGVAPANGNSYDNYKYPRKY